MPSENNRQRLLEVALSQIKLPIDITLRLWTVDDFPAIQKLSSAEGWPTPEKRPAEALTAWSTSWPTLVAVEAEQIVGFVRAFSDEAITTYIMELLVDPLQRGRGTGHLLLDACHFLYPCTRIEVLSTDVSERFYVSHGFRRIGVGLRKSYV